MSEINWENRRGTISQAELDEIDVGLLKQGKPVAFYGEGQVKSWTLDEQIANLKARRDQIEAGMDEIKRRHPHIGEE
jgi:hypothetical protein